MDKKEGKKGFWASLFAPKSCCCGPQIEEIKEEKNEEKSEKEKDKEEDKKENEAGLG